MNTKEETLSFSDMCRVLNRPPGYVRTLQGKLGLYIPPSGDGYTSAYVAFMEKIQSLRLLSVPMEDIESLFQLEKKLLTLLKIDSLSASKTWYLDACASPPQSDDPLLLTNMDVSGHLSADGGVQISLDFSERPTELFPSHEMGEDVRRVRKLYNKQRTEIVRRVKAEAPILQDALRWAGSALLR